MHSQQRLQVCSNSEKRIAQSRNYSKRMEKTGLELKTLGLGAHILQIMRSRVSDTNLGPRLSFVCKAQERSIPILIFEKKKINSYLSASPGFALIHPLYPQLSSLWKGLQGCHPFSNCDSLQAYWDIPISVGEYIPKKVEVSSIFHQSWKNMTLRRGCKFW